MKSRRPCCIDTNIFFDFIAGDIFDQLFLLPFSFQTSEFIPKEISGSFSRQQLKDLGVNLLILTDAEVKELHAIKQQHIELSIDDVSVFYLSRKHNIMILSSDELLRNLAAESGIEYHGTLWLLEELIKNDLLSSQEAADALRKMLGKKRWLPIAECEKLINMWESEK
ncbi:MAG: hypothetical protein OS112_00390 [Methanoregula sp.]|nr:MAG: hypothetical protein OS112_00390 [Methanoregula sp.]